MRTRAWPCFSIWYLQGQELHAELNALAEAILRWIEYIILLNKRFHSGVDQFFEDPIKVEQQRNRLIIVWWNRELTPKWKL